LSCTCHHKFLATSNGNDSLETLKEKRFMTIRLSCDLEAPIQAAVQSGRFVSLDEAMAQAARLLLRELAQGRQNQPTATAPQLATDPIMGLMRDDVELMDEIVADAYRQRR
jgi:Arc/MetJ-type ribon-helix-helix transcriptional regulator